MTVFLYVNVFFILHSYLIYPATLYLYVLISRLKAKSYPCDYAPEISVLIAAHNEESVIEAKINSVLNVDYPAQKLTVYIGSDNSTDRTNEILNRYARLYPGKIKVLLFNTRTGKPEIINTLAKQALKDCKEREQLVFIITDADITHEPSSFKLLARHFADPKTDLVDTHLINQSAADKVKAGRESDYLRFEVHLKHLESVVWKRMMGPFGGCFAIRASACGEVPGNFLVDDFYLAMRILEKGNYVINDKSAFAFEESVNDIRVEYKRKRRISAGNYQNLSRFRHLLFSGYPGLSYAFISHKVLRWLTPFFLLNSLIVFVVLCILGIPFYIFATKLIILLLIVMLIIDFANIRIFKSAKITGSLFYFILMNIALLHGFIDYTKGVRTNVWQPTKRINH